MNGRVLVGSGGSGPVEQNEGGSEGDVFEEPSVTITRWRHCGNGLDRRGRDGAHDAREASPRRGGVSRRAAADDAKQAVTRQMPGQDRESQPLANALQQLSQKVLQGIVLVVVRGWRIVTQQHTERTGCESRAGTRQRRLEEVVADRHPTRLPSHRPPSQTASVAEQTPPGHNAGELARGSDLAPISRPEGRTAVGLAAALTHRTRARVLPRIAQPVPDVCLGSHDSMKTSVRCIPDNSGDRGRHLTRTLVLAAVLTGAILPATPAIAQVAPDEDWRTLDTEHFRITYPDPLYPLATRLADRAERAYSLLASSFSAPPPGRIDIVLTDHGDFSNGFANVVPTNRITLYARPPADGRSLTYFDDWMELVVTHELVHIFHLDPARGLGKVLRAVLGRYPATWPFFPGRATPTWLTEGVATYYESTLTDAGRVHGSWQDMVLRTGALEGDLETLSTASGRSPVWPAGQRPYIYGSEFFNYLLQRTDGQGLRELVDGVAGQLVPYRIDAAARSAFGVSFSQAWEEWSATVSARYRALADSLATLQPVTTGEALTRGAREALYPRVSPDGFQLAFARADGRSDPHLRLRALADGRERQLTRTNGTAEFAWAPDGGVVFAQLEFVDRYRVYSDLYRAAPDGHVTRITEGQRLGFPDVHPGGDRVVAVQEGGGTNRLVIVDLATGEVRPLFDANPDEHWAFPRWSPDGSWIAASQWRSGGLFDVVILDSSGELVTRVTDDRAVDVSPAWSPDGRILLWSSDRTGISNLFAASVDESGRAGTVMQVTNVLTGATYPAPDPAGQWIYYSAYHQDGWDIERIPYAPEKWFEPFPTDARFLAPAGRTPERYTATIEAESRPYRAFRSLLPTYWQPLYAPPRRTLGRDVIGRGYGFATSGRDLVNRHAFWSWGRFVPDRRRAEGRFGYTARALGDPVFTLSASQLYDPAGATRGEHEDGAVDTLFVVDRERRLDLSVDFLRPRYRNAVGLTLTASHSWVSSELLDATMEPSASFRLTRPTRRSGEVSATLGFGTARSHAMSMSRENGLSGFVRGRAARVLDLPEELAGDPSADEGFEELAGRLSLYKSLGGGGFARQVMALRASGGIARGPGADGFHFEVGDAAGSRERITGFGLFGGSPLLFPLRGYAPASRRGRIAWSVSAEYRLPLFLIRRGFGAWPLYFDRTSASLFMDAGNAWGPLEGAFSNPKQATLASAGLEVTVNALPFWTLSTDLRMGVGFPLVAAERVGAAEEGTSQAAARFYLRLGSAF